MNLSLFIVDMDVYVDNLKESRKTNRTKTKPSPSIKHV